MFGNLLLQFKDVGICSDYLLNNIVEMVESFEAFSVERIPL
jgi:hypothetical protein